MKNGKNLSQYSDPLPIPILPPVYPHNPISWIYFLYNYFCTLPKSISIHVIFHNNIFKVIDQQDQLILWRKGFFGKGTLSRSEPTWFERTEKRLGLNVNVAPGSQGKILVNQNSKSSQIVSREDVTKIRRDERKIFKSTRQQLHDLIVKSKLQKLDENEILQLENLKIKLDSIRNQSIDYNIRDDSILRDEDLELLENNNHLKQLEFLQLQPVEAFFLKFGLNVINLDFDLPQLFNICCNHDLIPTNKFIFDYVVYHHYRSLGWCVRSGIKFGCDMLLYKRGPPFSHAEHAILIVNDQDSIDWFQLTTLTRVIGTVKKNLVIVFVSCPSISQFSDVLDKKYKDDKARYYDLFQLYKVSEIIYRRWAPSRTRD